MNPSQLLEKPLHPSSRLLKDPSPLLHSLSSFFNYPTTPLRPSPTSIVVHRPLPKDFNALLKELREYDRWEKELLRALHAGLSPLEVAREIGLRGAAAGAWTFTNATRTNLLNGTHDIDSDTHKEALLLSTSNIGSGSTTHAGVTNEHSNANGYTTGGIAITLTLAGTTTVTVDISTDPVWTASGGSITARFAEIYEVAGQVICYCLLDSTPADVTATDGNTLTVQTHASGVFTLA